MRRTALFIPAIVLSAPAFADEIKCEGVFGVDSTLELIETTFGKENVVTGEADGPEGSTIIATTIFPNDPEKRMVVGWWDEENRTGLSYVEIPDKDSVAGLHDGLTVKEVEALNGEPFTMTGFWWDYGGYAGFQSGKLADIPGGCVVSVYFQPTATPDIDTTAVSGDIEVPSSEPLLETLAVKVDAVTVGYPFPDLEGMEEAPAEDTRG